METYTLEPFSSEAITGQERWVEKGPFALRLYAIGADEIADVAHRLKTQTERAHARPLTQNIEALHRVGTLWSNPIYPLRQEATKVLPSLTNLSPETVEHVLDKLLGLLRRETLVEWIERELGDSEILESWVV